MKDLFGAQISDDEAFAGAVNAGKKKRKDVPKGYAAPPGTGPEGETCKSCEHSYYHEYAKRYWKCALVKPTRGIGTDIRLKWAACRHWAAKKLES